MSVNKKTNDNIKRAAAYVFSALCGTAASAALILIFSGIMYAVVLPPHTAGVMSFIAFAAGCMLCGFICGCIKKRGGLKIGLISAVIMTFAVIAVSFFTGNLTGTAAFAKSASALCASCIGSVVGVNRRR